MFKKGDRVFNKETGKRDTVASVPGMNEYDQICFMDADKGFLLEKGTWEYQEDWSLLKINKKTKMTKKTVRELHLTPKERAQAAVESVRTLIETGLMEHSKTYVKKGVRHYDLTQKDLRDMFNTLIQTERFFFNKK